jgi:hypothetical protein
MRARAMERDLKHRGRNINADHGPSRPYPVSKSQRRLTATTANVENLLALGRLQRIDGRKSQGFDLAVEQLVKLSPDLASYRVPMFDLRGVRRGLQGIRHVNVLAWEFSALRNVSCRRTLETAGGIVSGNADLDLAMKQALQEMIAFIRERTGWTTAQAYKTCSLAVDFKVTQNVNGEKGVHGMLKKGLLF